MKPQELDDKEGSFINDHGDRIILEIIKGMSFKEMRHFDVYKPIDLLHYNTTQTAWLITEKHLISHRGGGYKKVTEIELIEDIDLHNNGERFRVFYVLKYPDLVHR